MKVLSTKWEEKVGESLYAQMRSNLTASTMNPALRADHGEHSSRHVLMGNSDSGGDFDRLRQEHGAVLGDGTSFTSRNGHGSRWTTWWNNRDRKKIKTEYAEPINRCMIAATPNSET